MFQKLLTTVFLFAFSLTASAKGHTLGSLTGTHIELKSYDHAIAGSVRDFVIWGYLDESTFSSDLVMRRDGQLVKATFKRDGEKIGGVIEHMKDAKRISTEIFLQNFDKDKNTFHLTINNKPLIVKVEADDFSEGHFINPTYNATFADGTELSFRLEGEACYGYSMHLIFQVIGAYSH